MVALSNLTEKKEEKKRKGEQSFIPLSCDVIYVSYFFSFCRCCRTRTKMNPSSSSMAPVLVDYHQKSANLRSKILKNEEQRIQLEQKLRSLSNVDSRLKQRQQIDYIQSYFTQLNQESQRAELRNSQLLNDITQAEHNLNQLRIDTEHLIRLKHDYLQYLESNYPDWQKRISTEATTNVNTYDFNRPDKQQNGKKIRDRTSSGRTF
jgi:chromosome segregation ATPase